MHQAAVGNFSVQDIIDTCSKFDDFLKSKGEPKQITMQQIIIKRIIETEEEVRKTEKDTRFALESPSEWANKITSLNGRINGLEQALVIIKE